MEVISKEYAFTIGGNGSEPMQYQLNIPIIESEPLTITLESGSGLFILGPNGSGKSALIQHAVTSLGTQNVRRISAHRQTWMESGAIRLNTTKPTGIWSTA